jgi:hypothetical protein
MTASAANSGSRCQGHKPTAVPACGTLAKNNVACAGIEKNVLPFFAVGFRAIKHAESRPQILLVNWISSGKTLKIWAT